MARPPANELTERALEVMQVFWRREVSTSVAEVREELNHNGRELAYTTVATLVRILFEKKFLTQVKTQRPFQFRPCRTFQDVSQSLVADMVQRVFGGSREKLLLHLFEHQELSGQERDVLEQILKECEK